jgi:hypothetical protein
MAGFRFGAEVGTLGYGITLEQSITPSFTLRAVGHTGSYSRDLQKESIDYNGKLKLGNAGVLLDLHPGGSGFRLSAGVFTNQNKIDLVSKSSGTIVVDGVPYNTALVGNITGDVKFARTSPYAGIGWSRRPGRGWGASLDVGVLFQGSPKLRVEAHPTMPALVPASFSTSLEAERVKTERDLENYKYYPAISFGVSYGF